MNTHITINELCQEEGFSYEQIVKEYGEESVVPACCSHGCFVEPDGTCEHGNPSFLIELNIV
mgnify:CR=1 FL=1